MYICIYIYILPLCPVVSRSCGSRPLVPVVATPQCRRVCVQQPLQLSEQILVGRPRPVQQLDTHLGCARHSVANSFSAASNISGAQIQSQFPILNADFRKTNSNFLTSTPAAFQGIAADVELEFCLASVDPNGVATTGITRTSVPANFNYAEFYYAPSLGGIAGWNPFKYLNVWIGNLEAIDNASGFAWPPGTAPAPEADGAVFDSASWGTIGTALGEAGRTATHEVGHYFGL